jgi:hypothetical protein
MELQLSSAGQASSPATTTAAPAATTAAAPTTATAPGATTTAAPPATTTAAPTTTTGTTNLEIEVPLKIDTSSLLLVGDYLKRTVQHELSKVFQNNTLFPEEKTHIQTFGQDLSTSFSAAAATLVNVSGVYASMIPVTCVFRQDDPMAINILTLSEACASRHPSHHRSGADKAKDGIGHILVDAGGEDVIVVQADILPAAQELAATSCTASSPASCNGQDVLMYRLMHEADYLIRSGNSSNPESTTVTSNSDRVCTTGKCEFAANMTDPTIKPVVAVQQEPAIRSLEGNGTNAANPQYRIVLPVLLVLYQCQTE